MPPKITCSTCGKSYSGEASLSAHKTQTHRNFGLAIDVEGREIRLRRQDGMFNCVCDPEQKKFATTKGFEKHISTCAILNTIRFYQDEESHESDVPSSSVAGDVQGEDELDDELDPRAIVAVNLSSFPSLDCSAITTSKREYDHAVLHACEATDWGRDEQQRVLSIMDSYKLRPLSLTTESHGEANALTHQSHLPRLNSTMNVCPSPARKRIREEPILPSISSSLYSVLASGPYAKLLLQDNYVEMNDELSTFLNDDWTIDPQMRYACSRLLAGMIMVHSPTGKAVIVNSVEIYGRQRVLDSHRESFRVKLDTTSPTSLPPHKCYYANVWPTTLLDADGKKLLVGSKTFNALITSSLRIDKELEPDVGATTSRFVLENHQESLETHIYLKESAWDAAKKLAHQEDASAIDTFDKLYQLRQLRTRFHHSSTYLQCRSANEPVNDLATRPYTVFTLANYDAAHDDASYRTGSLLLQTIATSMIQGRPQLARSKVELLAVRIKSDTQMKAYFQEILALFDTPECLNIEIMSNKELNSIVEKIARSLIPQIAKANKSVKAAVTAAFRC